jgi:hypothetical protein
MLDERGRTLRHHAHLSARALRGLGAVAQSWRTSGNRGVGIRGMAARTHGRIVYDTENERFILYADAQILGDPALIAEIHEKFGLPIDRTDAKRDNHYQRTRRLSRSRLDENR